MIVKLLASDRYTTPSSDGRFAFYNLPEGEYDLAIDLRNFQNRDPG